MNIMNKLLLLVALFLSANVYSQTPVNPNATEEAKELLQLMYDQTGNGTWTGQHSYPLYIDMMMERVENLVGHYPVVFGQDFGYSKPNSLDGINFRQRVIDNAIKWYKTGAIITLMWHAAPPTVEDNFTTWKGEKGIQSKLTDEQWEELLTDGTELNTRWKSQVDVIAYFLKQLQDEKIPVIWRPYHEMNGDWFWWGARPGEKGYVALYKMLYDRLTNYHHINNLLWVYNANELGSDNVGKYEDFYPGDQYVDILATDIYNSNYAGSDYDDLQKLAKGKPIAWGECGKLPTPEICRQQPNWVWFMCWCEYLEVANDWKERMDIYEAEETITLEEFLEMQKEKK